MNIWFEIGLLIIGFIFACGVWQFGCGVADIGKALKKCLAEDEDSTYAKLRGTGR